MNRRMNKIEKILRVNKKTYLYAKRVKIRENLIKSAFQLVGAILTYPRGKKETLAEYNTLKKEGFIYQPKNKKVHSKFYLPLLKLEEDLESDAIQYSIFMFDDYYEFDELERMKKKNYIGKDTVVLDNGSNIGNHMLFFSNECKCKKVYAFEPVLDTYKILERNIEINHLEEKVTAYNYGVGESVAKANLSSYDLHNIGGATLELSNDGAIPILSIDSLELKDKVGFVKIDTEGFEVGVMKGMMKTVERDKPVFWIETSGENFETIKKMLKPFGYKNIYSLGIGDYIFSVK